MLDIVKSLKAEKYDVSQIEGKALKKQLLQIIQAAVLNKQAAMHDQLADSDAIRTAESK